MTKKPLKCSSSLLEVVSVTKTRELRDIFYVKTVQPQQIATNSKSNTSSQPRNLKWGLQAYFDSTRLNLGQLLISQHKLLLTIPSSISN